MYRTATFDPGTRINVVEREVTVALTSERRRATHSGTGDGAGRGAAMENYKRRNNSPCSERHSLPTPFARSGGKNSRIT